jgi:hypothetical protein
VTLPANSRDAPDQAQIDFEIDRPLTPAQVSGPKSDTRSLGVYLRGMQVKVEG